MASSGSLVLASNRKGLRDGQGKLSLARERDTARHRERARPSAATLAEDSLTLSCKNPSQLTTLLPSHPDEIVRCHASWASGTARPRCRCRFPPRPLGRDGRAGASPSSSEMAARRSLKSRRSLRMPRGGAPFPDRFRTEFPASFSRSVGTRGLSKTDYLFGFREDTGA